MTESGNSQSYSSEHTQVQKHQQFSFSAIQCRMKNWLLGTFPKGSNSIKWYSNSSRLKKIISVQQLVSSIDQSFSSHQPFFLTLTLLIVETKIINFLNKRQFYNYFF